MMPTTLDWFCTNTWKQSAKNTSWCLFGCAIGDFGTILYFQIYNISWPSLLIMIIAIINGLITSILLETLVLLRQMTLIKSFQTAITMSFLSMIAMEISMNTVDLLIVGKASLNIYVVPLMLFAGFITPLPYNYWRLKKYNVSCH